MDTILSRVACKKHGVPTDIPCWWIYPDSSSSQVLMGVCGTRTKKAGFVGKVNPRSLQIMSVRKNKN